MTFWLWSQRTGFESSSVTYQLGKWCHLSEPPFSRLYMCKSTEGYVSVCVCVMELWGGFSEKISTKCLTGCILTKAQRKSSINFDCYYYYQWVCLEKDTAWVRGFPGWLSGKRIRLQCRRPRFHHWVRKIPWRWATHSSTLAWRIPWTEKPGGLQPMGLQRVRNDWARTPWAYRRTTVQNSASLLSLEE